MQQQEVFNYSLDTLKNCARILGTFHTTCCIPERAVLFRDALNKLRNALHELQFGSKSVDTLPKCVKNVIACGTIVGEIYATCCTPLRTPTYGDVLGKLNVVANDLGMVLAQMKGAKKS